MLHAEQNHVLKTGPYINYMGTNRVDMFISFDFQSEELPVILLFTYKSILGGPACF